MRCFIAIDVNDAVRDAAMQTVEKLKKRGFRASWVKRENVHLTLFFLGEVQPRQVDEIAQHLCQRVRGFPSFSFVESGDSLPFHLLWKRWDASRKVKPQESSGWVWNRGKPFLGFMKKCVENFQSTAFLLRKGLRPI